MSSLMRNRLSVLLFLLLCSVGSIGAAWQVRNWGDALSGADPFSESNVIREVHNFLDTGLLANAGLGNVLRPDLYPDEGFQGYPESRPHSVTPSGIYTHYPPGPEYILYVAMRVLGTHPISLLRGVPLTITWLAAVFFGFSLRRRFGTTAAAIAMLACAVLPAFSDSDSLLHYEGYAFALLLVEIGLALGRNAMVLPFGLLGFFQGWLSFDYVFLVTLVPGAIELAMPRLDPDHTARKRLAFSRCAAAGAGFVLAHVMHLCQVCAFYGSLPLAVRDLSDAAAYRTGEIGPLLRIVLTCLVLRHYLIGPNPISMLLGDLDTHGLRTLRGFRFGGLTLGIWWLLLTHVFIAAWLRQGRERPAGRRRIDNDWLAVTLCGVVPSCLWYIAMPAHAFIHEHLLYRHLFFCFFLGIMFCAIQLANVLHAFWPSLRGALPGPGLPVFAAARAAALPADQQHG